MVGTPPTRAPQFLRRVQNCPAIRRRSNLAVFTQLMLVASGIAFGGAGAYAAHDYATSSGMFRLRRLVVDNVPAELVDAVRGRIAGAAGANLLTTDLQPWQQRIETIPQVERAHLRRILPDGVEVQVELRRPRAILRAADGSYLLSADGIVLRRATEPAADLVEVLLDADVANAIDATRRLPAMLPGAAAYVHAVRIAEWLDHDAPGAFGSIVAYRLTRQGVVLVLRDAPWQILVGQADALAAKSSNFRALVRHAPPQPDSLIDLRYDDQVVVRTASASPLFE